MNALEAHVKNGRIVVDGLPPEQRAALDRASSARSPRQMAAISSTPMSCSPSSNELEGPLHARGIIPIQ